MKKIRQNFLEKEELYIALFVMLSLYLSLSENIIPKPFPWMKIGLSNIATIVVLEKFGKKMALEVVGLRIIIQGVMLGTIFSPGFIISLVSGIISTGSMIVLYEFREKLSLISISMVSGFLHNLSQLIIVYYLMFRNIDYNNRAVLSFVAIFLFVGMASGGIIGVIVEKIRIRKVNRL